MALTIEDGSGTVVGANSYVTLQEVRDYAALRGLTLPVPDADVEKLVIKATDYLESLGSSYKGSKSVPETQVLQWPRQEVVIDGLDFPIDEIPTKLKQAQCQLAVEINILDPLPTTNGFAIRRERVDVVETEYAISQRTSSEVPLPRMPKVDALLGSLMRGVGTVSVIRI